MEPLKDVLEEIIDSPNKADAILKARGIKSLLGCCKFTFWLSLFNKVMPHVGILFNQMQSRQLTMDKVNKFLSDFKANIQGIREWLSSTTGENPERLVVEGYEVLDAVMVNIVDRFSPCGHLVVARLFEKEQFLVYKQNFPHDLTRLVGSYYPQVDQEQLEEELEVFYGREERRTFEGLTELLQFFLDSNLDQTFVEMTRLIKILITVPMTTVEAERCFSTLRRVKDYLSSTMNNERLNDLAAVTIERRMLKSDVEFKEKVMEKFIHFKKRRLEYIYI